MSAEERFTQRVFMDVSKLTHEEQKKFYIRQHAWHEAVDHKDLALGIKIGLFQPEEEEDASS